MSEWKGRVKDSAAGNEKIAKEKETVRKARKKKETFMKKGYMKTSPCPHCPGLFANEVMKFVGFRGNIDSNGVCHIDPKGKKHEGEAFPPPVDKNRHYVGILRYELEIMTLIFLFSNIYGDRVAIAILMPRGHGKTYMNAWMDQIKMKWFLQNIMMLSETSARLKVGNWIYQWALRNGYLKDPESFARINTYQHFELINDTRMDIYKYMKEDLVGEHNYVLSLDDVVKRNWKHKPTDNERAKEHWSSNINYIIRSALYVYGTRKFEGDPLEHIIDSIEDCIVIKLSPFIRCPHDNMNEDGTYDPCDICRDDAMLAPELHTYDDLMKKMRENYESWYAEMMQNPHPMEGGMVDKQDCLYVKRPFFTDIQMVGIGVDSTENEMDSNDMVGIVSCTMGGRDEPEFTFILEDVRKMPYRSYTDKDGNFHKGIMETITDHVKFIQRVYPNVVIIIAIEIQGGGKYIIREARKDYKTFPWFKYVIGDRDKSKKKIEDINQLGIRHSKEKKMRVFSELQFPIKKHQVRFSEILYGSELLTQICSFPNGRFDDGADAAGMIKDELLKLFRANYEHKESMSMIDRIREQQAKKQFTHRAQPWLAVQEQAKRTAQMKNRKRRIL